MSGSSEKKARKAERRRLLEQIARSDYVLCGYRTSIYLGSAPRMAALGQSRNTTNLSRNQRFLSSKRSGVRQTTLGF